MVPRTAWMFVHHPWGAFSALGLSKLIKSEFDQFNIVICKHGYWRDRDIKYIKQYFDNTYLIPKPHHPKFVTYEHYVTNFLKPLIKAKKRLSKLPIKQDDVFFGFDGAHSYVENIIISIFPKQTKISLKIPEEKQDHIPFKLVNLITNIIELFLGLYPTNFIFPQGKLPRYFSFKKPLNKIYNEALELENISEKRKTLCKGKLYYPLFALRNYKKTIKKTIVLFGRVQSGYDELTPKNEKTANRILNYIRKNYPGFKLIYKPHPLDKGVKDNLDLTGFNIDESPAEMFLLKEINNIHTAFSFCSTSSIMALNYGIPSYIFYPLIDMPESIRENYRLIFLGLPPEVFISNLSIKPRKYSIEQYVLPAKHYSLEYLRKIIPTRKTYNNI